MEEWRSESIEGGEDSDSSEIYRFLSDRRNVESYRHEKLGIAVAEKRYYRICRDPEIWVYTGRERDYLLVPRLFCSCPDFMINVVARGRRTPCYHLVGLEMARLQGSYRELNLGFDWVMRILHEVLGTGFSSTLRRLWKEEAGI